MWRSLKTGSDDNGYCNLAALLPGFISREQQVAAKITDLAWFTSLSSVVSGWHVQNASEPITWPGLHTACVEPFIPALRDLAIRRASGAGIGERGCVVQCNRRFKHLETGRGSINSFSFKTLKVIFICCSNTSHALFLHYLQIIVAVHFEDAFTVNCGILCRIQYV